MQGCKLSFRYSINIMATCYHHEILLFHTLSTSDFTLILIETSTSKRILTVVSLIKELLSSCNHSTSVRCKSSILYGTNSIQKLMGLLVTLIHPCDMSSQTNQTLIPC